MRFEMKMPDLATTDSEIRIVRWMIEPSERVQRGQPLLEVETDKASMEVESVVSGVLTEVHATVNAAVSVGQVIAVLEVEETAAKDSAAVCGPDVAAVETSKACECQEKHQGDVSGAGSRSGSAPGRMFARNRAAAGAREASVRRANARETTDIPLTVAQRAAAKRLQESKQTVPHFYLQRSVNATRMLAYRKAVGTAKLAWDAFFVRAVARAIGQFDRFRCRIDGDRLTPAGTEAIGVAVDHEDELYVVPIDSPSDKKIEEISAEIRQSAERIRGGDMEAKRTRPALMTVTNLGVDAIESFIPIINPPEPAILGIGRVMPTPVAREDGWIGVEPRCALTLSVDHRVASGRYAAQFLARIIDELERVSE